MSSIKSAAAAVLVIGTLLVGGQHAGASSPTIGPPFLSTSYSTVFLSHYAVTSTSCGQILTASGQRFGGCVHADGAARRRPRLDQRIKAAFRGTATLTVPENTDSVFIGYGQQPSAEYGTRPTVIWPIPGSGTYHVRITMKWHDEFTTSETTYLVPLWVPRNT